MSRHGLGVGRVVLVFLVVGGLSSIGWLLWQRTGRLIPAPPLLAALLFGLLIAFILATAWPVRAYLRSKGARSIDPIRATRALFFAQAGALTGAALAGWYAAQLTLVLADLDLSAYQARVWRFVLLTAGAMLLAAAGLWAQSWCRVDPPKDRDPDRDANSGRE